jgi:hypothetical protein
MAMKLVTLTCLSASALGDNTRFDSDSKQIAIDNCSSRCLTNSRADFLPGTVTGCNVAILGVGGRVKCNVKGTVSWTIKDDQGRAHEILIPDTPLCTALPHRLFSPQHWAQETERGISRKLRGTMRPSCSTNADATVLSWGRGKFTKTIKLDKDKNVSVMMTKSGCKQYTAFAASVSDLEPAVSCFVATGAPAIPDAAIITDEEDPTDEDEESSAEELEDQPIAQVDFENQRPSAMVSEERDTPMSKDKDEMYRLHVRAGHLSYSKLRAMAR